ncbi:MAG: polysaccharide biosynthesis C-terminal domain-containing protein, partial [Anaeroplasmataceae bacterium]
PYIFKTISKIKISHINLKKHLIPSLYIFLPTLAVTIYSVFDKTMIGLLADNPNYANGIFEQAYMINGASLILITFISPVLASRNSYDYSRGNIEDFKKNIYFSSNYVLFLAIPMILGFVVLSKSLTSWYIGDGFKELPLLLVIMSIRFIASGFSEIFGTQICIAIGKEKIPILATFLSAIVNVCLNLALIPILGAVGAAIATAICEIVVTLVLMIMVYRLKLVSYSKIALMSLKYIIAGAIMFFVIFLMNKYLDYSIFSFFLIVMVGGIIYGTVLIILRDKFVLNFITQTYNMLRREKKNKDTE